MDRLENSIGGDLSKWYITRGRDADHPGWYVCQPLRDKSGASLCPPPSGAQFATGEEALAAFAGGGFPLTVDQLTEACRPYEWRDTSGNDRWAYIDGDWHWGGDDGRYLAGNESDVAELYPWCGPYTRITGPGIPA